MKKVRGFMKASGIKVTIASDGKLLIKLIVCGVILVWELKFV
jgi:hypothetical protein